LVHGDSASAQGNWSIQVAGPSLAGTLPQLCLHLPDCTIEVFNQEIEECCQTVGLHLSNDLEGCLAPVKFINNLHAGHMSLLQMAGRMGTLLAMTTELVPRIYRQVMERNMSQAIGILMREVL
jgi:hypothetical protein